MPSGNQTNAGSDDQFLQLESAPKPGRPRPVPVSNDVLKTDDVYAAAKAQSDPELPLSAFQTNQAGSKHRTFADGTGIELPGRKVAVSCWTCVARRRTDRGNLFATANVDDCSRQPLRLPLDVR